jgi:hypothetical protein
MMTNVLFLHVSNQLDSSTINGYNQDVIGQNLGG